MLECSLFETELGWFALAGSGERVCRLMMGQPSRQAARESILRFTDGPVEFRPWHPDLERRLVSYAEGAAVDFDDIEIDGERYTPFQQRVVANCRRIPRGATASYGELAAKSGSPRAARAVGNTMAANRFPIIVPCHRVVGAAGALGGFSAPAGIRLKEQLLELEGACLAAG